MFLFFSAFASCLELVLGWIMVVRHGDYPCSVELTFSLVFVGCVKKHRRFYTKVLEFLEFY